jgi:ribose transport system ATP-binding protein
MLGRRLADLTVDQRLPSTPRRVRARVRGLRAAGLSEPFSLELTAGEIVGLTGLPGSGFERVPYLITGAAAPDAGSVEIGGERMDLPSADVATMMRRGIVLVPEDRLHEGLSIAHSVRDNITLPWLSHRGRPWAAGGRWRTAQTRAAIDELGVRPTDPRHLISRLSGGNQQKVLLGKWLAGGPELLVLHEPTQAVDVAARQDLVRAIHRVSASGTTVLVASSEVADLSLLCHRVLVFADGRVSTELTEDVNETAILAATYGRAPDA